MEASVYSDYSTMRRRHPSAFGLFARSRPIVMSDKAMKRFGGAAVIYGFTFVARGVVDAPESVRAALLAHEWGHIARGHSFATLLSLVLLAAYIAAPSPPFALAVLCLLAPCVLWQINPARELEADAVAVQLVGAANVADALEWAVARYAAGEPTPTITKRLAKISSCLKI
jgi:Zn-dependent protease with chaperone function